MKYSDQYIDDFRLKVKELGFVGCDWLPDLTNDQIRKCINGIGSAAMPSALRKALDSLHPSLVYASHVHDCYWQYIADGSDADFHLSNDDFCANGVIMAKHMYGWYNPIRFFAIHKARQFREILEKHGYTAYLASRPN